MQYQIQGQPYPVVVLTVEPEETVLCQKGAMAWMTPNMEMQTKGGGLGKMFSRAFTGESMFQNHYTAKGGQGMIAFASAVPGEIMPVQISPERSIVAQKSAFLASEAGVNFELFFQKKLAGGFFGGEGFIMQKFSGNGMLFLEVDGSMVAYDLAPDLAAVRHGRGIGKGDAVQQVSHYIISNNTAQSCSSDFVRCCFLCAILRAIFSHCGGRRVAADPTPQFQL